jgi:excisionase family DNA binding protein
MDYTTQLPHVSSILPTMNLLTTVEVAERLGVHRSRVHALIAAGRLPAQKYGNVYLVKESDLKLVAERKPGRPPTKAGKKK